MTTIVCPACRGWRRHSFDRFCGACGTSFITLAARVDPPCSYQGGGPQPRTLEIRLENRGSVDPRGTVVVLRESGTETELHRQTIPEGQLAAEHDFWCFSVDLPPRLHAAPWRGELVHLLPDPSPAQRLRVVEFGNPMPVVALREARLGLPAGAAAPAVTLALVLKDGGAAPIASLVIEPGDGTAPHGTAPHGPAPRIAGATDGVLLLPGQPAELSLELDGELVNRLRRQPGGLAFILSATLEGSPRPLRLPFSLFVETPARPDISVPPRFSALAGRESRLPVTIVNRGGQECTMLELHGSVTDGANPPWPFKHAFSGAAARLAAGETRTVELRLAPPEGKAAAGSHRGTVTLALAPGVAAPKSRSFILDVLAPRPFDGIVSIDFGTTASAVACLRHGDTQPRIVPLTAGSAFIPTSIAYVLDPQEGLLVRIGDEARRWAEAPDGRFVLYFDDLKWRLTSRETLRLPDGSTRSWIDIAADYLRALRLRIEEHPDVAALVRQIHPSRPARFGSAACAALRLAFRRAGMEAVEIGTGDGGHTMISESWSPLLLALPLQQLAPMQHEAIGSSELLGPVVAGTHRILTYDVGGGSTDLSLFVIEVKDRATITVREVATEGTSLLCGNAIAALLFRHLHPSLEGWLERNGHPPDAIPFQLPWDEVPPDGIDPVAGANGRALLRLLRALQDWNGPFLDIITARGSKPLFAPDDAELMEWLRAHQKEVMPTLLLDGMPLRLTMIDGGVAEVPWGRDGLELDLPSFLAAFVREIEQPMKALHASALGAVGKEEEPPHLVTTGRGGLFPLVNAMTREHHDGWQAKRAGKVWRVNPDYLKIITSLGSVLLADLSGSATGIVFRSDLGALFGCVGDLEPTTGRQRFLRLSAGYPEPDDGVIAAHRPLPPGNLVRRFEFGMAQGEGDILTARFQREFSVQGRVDLTAEEAVSAHILVEARRPFQLTVSIGVAVPNDGADWSSRRTIELGTVLLIPESDIPETERAEGGAEPATA